MKKLKLVLLLLVAASTVSLAQAKKSLQTVNDQNTERSVRNVQKED